MNTRSHSPPTVFWEKSTVEYGPRKGVDQVIHMKTREGSRSLIGPGGNVSPLHPAVDRYKGSYTGKEK